MPEKSLHLTDLIPADELKAFLKRQYSHPSWIMVDLLDGQGNPVLPDSLNAYRICPRVSNQRANWCLECPLQTKTHSNGVMQGTCHAHIVTTIRRFQIDGESFGHAVHQHPLPEFFEIEGWESNLPTEILRHLRHLQHQPLPDFEQVRRTVAQTAKKLERWVATERRFMILGAAVDSLAVAKRSSELAKTLLHNIHWLLGKLIVCLYFERVNGEVCCVEDTGPEVFSIPDPLPLAQQGHVGAVIRSGETLYAPDLENNPQGFSFDEYTAKPACALTVPLKWHDDRPAALQILSPEKHAFPRAEQKIVERLAKIAGEMAVKVFYKEQCLSREDVDRPEGWTQVLVNLALDAGITAEDVLPSRRKLFEAFCSEVQRISGAKYTSIRLRDVSGLLRFTSCYPPDSWTSEKKKKTYTPTMNSVGVAALRTSRPRYLRDVAAPGVPYIPIHEDVKSLYVVPFTVKGEMSGVVAVDWDTVDAASEPILRRVDKLTAELEQILRTLAHREDELFQQFEDAFRVGKDIRVVGKLLVDSLREMFRAGACSLYLLPDGEDRLVQAASTAPPNTVDDPFYEVGEGLTGFVAKSQRPLLIRDTRDQEELNALSPEIHHLNKFPESLDYPLAKNHAFLAVPLITDLRVIGVVRLTLKQDREGELSEFSHEEESLLFEIATRIALSISTMWRTGASDTKVDLAGSSGDLNAAAQALCDEFCYAAQAAGAFMSLQDQATLETTEAATGLMRILLAEGCPKPFVGAEGYSGPTNLPDALGHETTGWLLRPRGAAHAIRSAARIILPLAKESSFTGYVFIIWKNEQFFLPSLKLDLNTRAVRYAQALTSILEQRRTATLLKRRLAEIGGIRNVGNELGLTTNYAELREKVLEMVIRESGADEGTMRLFDSSEKVWRRVAPQIADESLWPLDRRDHPLFQRSVSSREPYFVDDVDQDRLWIAYKEEAKSRGEDLSRIRSSLHIPLVIGDEIKGLILLEAQRPFLRDKADHLAILAAFVAVAEVFAQEQQGYRTLAFLGQMMSGFLHHIGNRLNTAYSWLSVIGQHAVLHPDLVLAHDELRAALDRIDGFGKELSQAALAGKEELTENIDLDSLVRDLVAEFEQRSDRNPQIFIETQLNAACHVGGSSVLLKTALRLVLQNALEAIVGEGSIYVVTQRVAGRRRVHISIRDTGVGMTDDVKARCFNFFYTTKEGRGGTGMGLPVVFGLIARHGGKLLPPVSAPGEGCTITIELPTL